MQGYEPNMALILAIAAYYIAVFAIFSHECNSIPILPCAFAALFGLLSYVISFKSSPQFKSIMHSKIAYEIFIIIRKFTGYRHLSLDILILAACILNILRSISTAVFVKSFDYEKKKTFFKDVLTMEKHIYRLFTGKELVNVEQHIRNTPNHDSKTLFTIISESNGRNETQESSRNHEVFQQAPPKILSNSKITLKSLSKYFSDPENVLRILTQGFDEDLDFQDFHDAIRQFNFERSNYINFLDGSNKTIALIYRIHWTIFILIMTALTVQLSARSGILKLAIYPFIICSLPLVFNLVEPFLFLVYTHPFDIGDRILIKDPVEDNLIVKSIGLTSTVFERWNNEIIICTNRHIRCRALKNIRRSKNQVWCLKISASASDGAKLAELEKFLKNFCKESTPLDGIVISRESIVDSSYLDVTIQVKHALNHQNGYFMWYVQNKFMKKLLFYLNYLKIRAIPMEVPYLVRGSCIEKPMKKH